MISRLTGRLIEKNPPQIVIDVNGVGYEADVSMQTFYNLPALGETVQLYTQLVVREDAHLLFGFATADERATFRQLVKVSGIGAKTALGILSAMSADELARAVADEDIKRLSSAPGIGKKTAERMVLELRGKLVSHTAADGLFTAAPAADERATFRQLVKVSGIGAKTALGILSAMSADELARAVADEDIKRLSSAPGIGKKTAERMVLELRGKLVSHTAADGLFTAAPAADETDDIVNTLIALGYNEREAKAAIKGIPKGTEVGEGVRLALKNLLK